MYTIFKMKADELDSRFLESLKTMFKNKEIEIVVCDVDQIEENETDYLLKSQANRDHLQKAIENVVNKKNLVSVNLDDLE